MNTFKRITAALLALVAIGLFAPLTGCGDKPESSSSAPSSACDTKGHEYSEKTGLCIRCEKKAQIPALSSKQKFPLVEPCPHDGNGFCPECDFIGSGENMWNRLELFEDCYTVEIGNGGALWLSFSAKQAGQYVLHSVDGDKGVEVTRHAANAHYVNEQGVAAVKENGDFYSYVNCGTKYFNAEWRATYCLKAPKGTQVKIRFIRVDEPAWEPETVRTMVYATELKQKAQDMPDDMRLTEVPYDVEYFFDESVGAYRMGTATSPGAIIYAAIDRVAPRLFGEPTEGSEETKFTNVLKTSGTALNLGNGLTEDGDYSVLCYTPFIMNWVNPNDSWGRPDPNSPSTGPEGDPNKVCYQNYCNDDGVYPVNQELFDFLDRYTAQNSVAGGELPEEGSEPQKPYLWLSACFYYEQIEEGTEDNPFVVSVGDFTANIPQWDYFYCVVREAGAYTIRCENPDINITIDGDDPTPLNGATITVTEGQSVTFALSHKSGSAVQNLTFTISKN